MDDLTILTTAAREAGEIARGYFRSDPEVWDKSGGQGPVTEADLAVDRMLRESLTAARTDYGWLSEETPDDRARLEAERVFIVDPIDGTRAFIDGSPTWSHSLAIAEAGEVVAAVVYLPMHDLLFTAATGTGTLLNGAPLRVSDQAAVTGAKVLAAKPIMTPSNWAAGTPPPFEQHFRSSLAYRMALVAQGRFDAMMTLRPTWEWDVAAGTLLVAEAGGQVTDSKGEPATFNRATPQLNGIVAGGAHVRAGLVENLA